MGSAQGNILTFTGKAGLVTGASGGIGRAAAISLAAAGGSVIVADLESARSGGEETVALVESLCAAAQFVATDVTSEESVKELVDRTIDAYGRLDFAFNNAGVISPGFTADLDERDFDRVVAVDLKGVWLSLKHEILYMKAHGGGRIVNTASEAGLVGLPLAASYTAAKHGVIGLTKTAAAEYANLNIGVNAVAPGAIATAMMTTIPEGDQQVLIDAQPLHRYGTPEEVASAVLFLLSEQASFITGAVLAVDGGATASLLPYIPVLNPGV